MTSEKNVDAIFNNAMAAFVRADFNAAISFFNQLVSLMPDSDRLYTGRGAAHFRLNQLTEALSDFSRAIELAPTNSRALHLRGLALQKAGDDNSALSDFNRAIELDPEYGAAYYSRAALLLNSVRTDAAQDDVEMVQHLINKQLGEYGNEINLVHTDYLHLEAMEIVPELDR